MQNTRCPICGNGSGEIWRPVYSFVMEDRPDIIPVSPDKYVALCAECGRHMFPASDTPEEAAELLDISMSHVSEVKNNIHNNIHNAKPHIVPPDPVRYVPPRIRDNLIYLLIGALLALAGVSLPSCDDGDECGCCDSDTESDAKYDTVTAADTETAADANDQDSSGIIHGADTDDDTVTAAGTETGVESVPEWGENYIALCQQTDDGGDMLTFLKYCQNLCPDYATYFAWTTLVSNCGYPNEFAESVFGCWYRVVYLNSNVSYFCGEESVYSDGDNTDNPCMAYLACNAWCQ